MQSASGNNNKVSVKQLILVIIVMTISPTVRFLPAYTAKYAAEAGWVTPAAAILPILIIIYIIHSIFAKYPDKNTPDIIRDILGKYIGTLALIVHLIWTIFLTGFYVRFNSERLVSSIYPNIDIVFFMIITLIVASYIVHSEERTIARLGEVLFPILSVILIVIMLLMLPNIRKDALLPISFSDTIPIIKGSIGILSIFCYLFVIFLFSENIVGKKNIKKVFLKGSAVLFIFIFLLLFSTFGMLGYSVIVRAPMPFLTTVKQISLMDTIENIESVVVATWMLSDALLIATLSTITLNIAKGAFKLSSTKPFINIFFILMFVLANGIAKNRMELDLIAGSVVTFVNVLIGYGTPLLLFTVGKIRKKL